MLQIFVEDMKQELRTIRKDVEDLKVSLQFSQGEIQDLKKNSTDIKLYVEQLEDRVKFVETNMEDTYDLERRCDDMENKHEYLENVSKRNNIKIVGLPEVKLNEKSWDDNEESVKGVIKEKLKVDVGVKIERAHRVGKPFEIMKDGSRKKIPPRSVIARLECWKQKEAILKAAREVKLKEIRFFQDLSAKTLQRRADQILKLIAERKKGNTACFIMDKLVINDRKDKS